MSEPQAAALWSADAAAIGTFCHKPQYSSGRSVQIKNTFHAVEQTKITIMRYVSQLYKNGFISNCQLLDKTNISDYKKIYLHSDTP